MTNLKIDIMMGNDESWAKFKKITTRYFRQRNSNRKKKFTVLQIVRGKRYGNWRNLKITAKCSLGVLENKRIKLGIENARGSERYCVSQRIDHRGVYSDHTCNQRAAAILECGAKFRVNKKQYPSSGSLLVYWLKNQPAEGLGNALC